MSPALSRGDFISVFSSLYLDVTGLPPFSSLVENESESMQ